MFLETPFPDRALDLAWYWLQHDQHANFDDYGPRDFNAFEVEMRRRLAAGERTWGVREHRDLVGIIGYLPITPRLGTFHGICFDSLVHGSGIPQESVRAVLAQLWSAGVEKVCASYFMHNLRVHRFLKGIGAIEEGVFRAQTLQNGKPVDMRSVALFRGGE